ncbi:hypothetical protein SDC9_140449 [bioreactor metagenome]|uniref:Uncharacterized protein n=1 Tax=bioreactor metagenome TaxID=1076179 RepID=A0A645DYA5_9ZZZZ
MRVVTRPPVRVAASAAADTTRKSANCTGTDALSIAAISAASAPATNQMDTSPAVAASATPKSAMAPSQIQIIIIKNLLWKAFGGGEIDKKEMLDSSYAHCITSSGKIPAPQSG